MIIFNILTYFKIMISNLHKKRVQNWFQSKLIYYVIIIAIIMISKRGGYAQNKNKIKKKKRIALLCQIKWP